MTQAFRVSGIARFDGTVKPHRDGILVDIVGKYICGKLVMLLVSLGALKGVWKDDIYDATEKIFGKDEIKRLNDMIGNLKEKSRKTIGEKDNTIGELRNIIYDLLETKDLNHKLNGKILDLSQAHKTMEFQIATVEAIWSTNVKMKQMENGK